MEDGNVYNVKGIDCNIIELILKSIDTHDKHDVFRNMIQASNMTDDNKEYFTCHIQKHEEEQRHSVLVDILKVFERECADIISPNGALVFKVQKTSDVLWYMYKSDYGIFDVLELRNDDMVWKHKAVDEGNIMDTLRTMFECVRDANQYAKTKRNELRHVYEYGYTPDGKFIEISEMKLSIEWTNLTLLHNRVCKVARKLHELFYDLLHMYKDVQGILVGVVDEDEVLGEV